MKVVFENNEPLFFGKEVAEILGYKDTDGAIRRHVDLEDRIELKDLENPNPVSATGSHPRKILINELGFYSLAFGSELPRAKTFKRWVFGEVLPQIRKTGSYSLNNGLLKLRDISEEEIKNMSESEKKEFKTELKKFQDVLKDPEWQRKGKNGGISLWKKIKANKEELDLLWKKLEDVLSIIQD